MAGDEDQTATRGVTAGAMSALLRELAQDSNVAAPPAPSPFQPGQVVGRFTLLHEIGRGGFGVVYEARDRELRRGVAFKALRNTAKPDLDEERLLREAEAAAQLSHPNIVTLYDVGRSDEGPFIVMELLRGAPLEDELSSPIEPGEALRIATEVAKGMAHAHAHGVVHRDLSPRNVFLCKDGQVKVLDFGLAHTFGRRKRDGGTRAYMAPEQRRGAPEDDRTDVFALGVILFRMLSGKLPFPDGAPTHDGSPPPALEVDAAPELGQLVRGMLESDPVKRPRDGGAVLEALTAVRVRLRGSAGPERLTVSKPLDEVAHGHRPLRKAVLFGGVVLACVAAAMGWRLLRASSAVDVRRATASSPSAGGRPSIAVLPFVDLSPQRDQEYFADGVAEEILNALAQVEGLRVTGRTSSFAFKGKSEDVRTIGQKLGVRAVLEGSVRRSGKRLRVMAQLIDAADGYQLWAREFDRDTENVFAVQDEIARAIVEALRVKLLPGHTPSTAPYRTASSEAHARYLLGRHLTRQGDYRRSVRAFEEALALEPRYAPAWAGLSVAVYDLLLDEPGQSVEDVAAATARSLAAAEQAITLAPDLGDGYDARAMVRTYGYAWAGAIADVQRAIALGGSDAPVHRRYGTLLTCMGQLDEAIAEFLLAIESDPLAESAWYKLAHAYLFARRYDLARAAIERALEIHPDASDALYAQGVLEIYQHHAAPALAAFARVKSEPDRLWGTALAEHELGHAEASQRAVQKLISDYGQLEAYRIAVAHAWRGERERALDWLERAYAQREPSLAYIKADWALRDLLGREPRYDAVLRKVNLPAE